MEHLKGAKMVYINNRNGTSSQSGYVYKNGVCHYVGINPNKPRNVYTKSVIAQKLPLYTHAQLKAKIKNSGKTKIMNYNRNVKTIIQTETAYGKKMVAREETPSMSGQIMTLTIGLDNTAGATAVKGVLGDGWNLIARKNKLSPFPPAFAAAITGNWDEATVSLLNSICSKTNLRVKGFQGRADNGAFWAAAPFKVAVIDLENSKDERKIDTETWQDGNQFNDEFRKRGNWRFIFANNTGIEFTIPAGRSVVLNLTIVSVGLTAAMNRV